ncbi:MAG: putative nucleoside-diphosphate-sugar epimerase [Labilithrix sp.]|nr:putative nucleoside-diphosphate-sugar epimerase [Labilithrix sp.]
MGGGVDCVYYLVHSMTEARSADFRSLERESANNVARAAARCSCRRIVYLGGVEPSGQPSEHLASRLEVGAILRGGEVPALELRAAMIIGNGSASWRILRDLALRLPMMLLPRWLESRSCPIALEDAVTALLDAREVPLERSTWFDIPGPEVLRAREMLLLVGALRGRRIPTVKVPLLTPRLSAGWLKLVSGVNYDVARELVLGLQDDLLPRDASYWSITGRPPGRTFLEAASRALETERKPRGMRGWLGTSEERLVASLALRTRFRSTVAAVP